MGGQVAQVMMAVTDSGMGATVSRGLPWRWLKAVEAEDGAGHA